MNFAAPAMLWALPLVAVPILIHLLQRRRTVPVDFAAMRFLAEALKRTRRRVLLEDMLLLFLRTLAVLALILGLARPSSESLPLALGREARAEVLLVDASMSMAFQDQGGSAFTRALEVASERLRELDASLDDRAALLRVGLSSERLAVGDPQEVLEALADLAPPRGARADLSAAFLAARQTAIDLGLPLARVRLTLLTDLQATQWGSDAPVRQALSRCAELGCPIEVIDCGADLRPNVAVTALELAPSQVVQGDSVDLSLRLRNFGTAPVDGTLEIRLDQDVVATRPYSLGPLEEQEQNLLLQPVSLGARTVEVQLAHDGLIEDDQQAAVIQVTPGLQLLLAGQLALKQESRGLLEAVAAFLDLGAEAPIHSSRVALSRLDQAELGDTDLLVLADPDALSPNALRRVSDWVASGGGLLILPGPATDESRLRPLLDALDLNSLHLGEALHPGAEAAARLEIVDPDLPALRFFADPRWRPLLTEVPFMSYRPLWIDPDSQDPPHAALKFVATEAQDNGLALVTARHGRGQVAVMTAAPLPGWNRMEEVPGGTLPLLFDLLFQLAPAPPHPAQTTFGAPLRLSLPAPATDITLRDRDGLRHRVEPAALGVAGRPLTLIPRATRLGVWDVEARMLLADGNEALRQDHFAVIPAAEESDLRPIERRLAAAGMPATVSFLDAANSTAEATSEEASHYPLQGLLFLIVLFALIGESLLAAGLDRRRMRP